jgi:hypothetical protein
MLSANLRARLASFPHAYAVALRLRAQTGEGQYIIRSTDPVRPVRVSAIPPRGGDEIVALVA